MNITSEVYTFFVFVIVGIILSIIFDIFRVIRMRKKYSARSIAMQDIIFWIIAGFIITFSIILFLREKLRVYIFIAMLLGSIIYILLFSRYIIIFLKIIFDYLKQTINFIFVPQSYVFKIAKKIYKIIIKTTKKYCIRIKDMICYIHKKLTKVKK